MVKIPRHVGRRKFLKALGLTAAGAAVGASYAHWLEPQWLEVERHQVNFGKKAGLPPLKVLHMADLHASHDVSLSFIASSVELALRQQPDIICLTGDFISGQYPHLDQLARVLAPLGAAVPTFATLGNHDGGIWSAHFGGYKDNKPVMSMLENAGIELLHNENVDLELRGWRLRLVGMGDLWSGGMIPNFAFPRDPSPADATIALAHNPDSKEHLKSYPWDVLLSGHTHGGQVRIPFVGSPFAPVHDKRFIAGLYRWEEKWLHITRGVGNRLGIRFNCRPEVSVLTFV